MGKGVNGVVYPCPPVDNDIVTPASLVSFLLPFYHPFIHSFFYFSFEFFLSFVLPLVLSSIFSRGHATLHLAVSVGQ